MLAQMKDLASIDAQTLKDAGGVVQAVAQHVNTGLAPRHEAAVKPDFAIAVVKGYKAHIGVRLTQDAWDGLVNKISQMNLCE